MSKTQKQTLLILILIGLAYLIIMGFPNFAGSEDEAMLWVFQPDEGSPLPYLMRMIADYDSPRESIFHFLMYGYYFYGFPYFAYSALLLLPLRLFNSLQNIPLVMLFLRQGVSVLPMLISLGIWVYLQTRFKHKIKSALLFIFLLSIPAVTANSIWWHPDSFVFLLVSLTLLFLDRDELKFGKFFYLAALTTGLATGTKIIGVYFILTIPTYLILGIIKNKLSWKKALLMAIAFVTIMVTTVIVANPTSLFYPAIRQKYIDTFIWQTEVVGAGYEIRYLSGLASWDVMYSYYGWSGFLLLSLIATIIQIFKGTQRLLHLLIFTWAMPFGIYTLIFVALKYQYLLPILLPLISSVSILIPPHPNNQKKSEGSSNNTQFIQWSKYSGFGLLTIWFILNSVSSITFYQDYLHRADAHPSFSFYQLVENSILDEIPEERELFIYHDPRMYVPDDERWYTEISFEMLNLAYFADPQPHLILLMQQRIYDYTSEYAQENVLRPELYQENFNFYSNANQGVLDGYHLIVRNEYGLAFVRDDVYQSYFEITP